MPNQHIHAKRRVFSASSVRDTIAATLAAIKAEDESPKTIRDIVDGIQRA